MFFILISYSSSSEELSVRLVGINADGKDTKLFNLKEIRLISNNYFQEKSLTDYMSGSIIKFDIANIEAGEKIKFIVNSPGWKVIYPYQSTIFRPKYISQDVITVKMVTNQSMLNIGNYEASFINKHRNSSISANNHYVQVYASIDRNKANQAQQILISRGFKKVKYMSENTVFEDNLEKIQIMHKVIIGPFLSVKDAKKVLKRVNRFTFFKKQSPYIR